MPSEREILLFTIVLQKYGIYHPEELYKVICPFHADKNASMQINIPRAFFFCYAECGAKGGSLELYKLFQKKLNNRNLTDLSALTELSSLLKQTFPNTAPLGGERGKGDYRGLGERGGNPPSYNLPSNLHDSLSTNKTTTLVGKLTYGQGITQAKQYYYSLPSPNWYRPNAIPPIADEVRECKRYMLSRGFSCSLLKSAQAKASLNSSYPIVVPMYENSIFRGYVMRTFDPLLEKQRKYMYPRGFKRELSLPGQYGIKLGSSSVTLVEGFLDKLKANQLGITHVAAILGWKLSGTQIEKLKRSGIKQLICATDNDEAGNKGYKYMLRVAEQFNFSVKRLIYPKGINDMGQLEKGTKQAQLVLNQISLFTRL